MIKIFGILRYETHDVRKQDERHRAARQEQIMMMVVAMSINFFHEMIRMKNKPKSSMD